jgi:signal transduction histidine kinase
LASGKFIGVQHLREKAAAGRTEERELIELSVPNRRVLEVGLRLSSAGSVSQILYFRDVTHETEVDQMKSDFLSTAAHELRTPMASIYGFAEVLLTQSLDEDSRKEFTGIIFRQSGLMASILNELLDLARIEARRGKDFELVPTDVAELVRKTVSEFRLPAERLAPVVTSQNAVWSIMVDRKKTQQAILNVLSNAYKYSRPGDAVEIFIEPARTANLIAIRTVDQGIGMSAEQVKRVSERFFRADTSGNVPGTGLGMSIVKEIVELHHGNLLVASAPGQGTSVTLQFPVA